MLPLPSRADETAALVAVVGPGGENRRSSRLVMTTGGFCVALVVGLSVLAISASRSWSFATASLGRETDAFVGGDTSVGVDAALLAARVVSSTSCAAVGDDGSCVAYAEDARACSATTNWRVDSCVRFADTAGGVVRAATSETTKSSETSPSYTTEESSDLSRKEKWIMAYYRCVNGAADQEERPYRIPKLGCGKRRFTQALSELDLRLGPRFGLTGEVGVPLSGRLGPGPLLESTESIELQQQARVNQPDEPYVWAFVHVPKTAGSFLTELFRAQQWRNRQRGERGGVGDVFPAGDIGDTIGHTSEPFSDDIYHPYYPNLAYAPVMDLTESEFKEAFAFYSAGGGVGEEVSGKVPKHWVAPGWIDEAALGNPAVSHVTNGFAKNGQLVTTEKKIGTPDGTKQTSPSGAARSFRAGRREIFKGSLAMGWCDVVRSPCAYVTVLREPIERLLSLHAYSCVLGSEAKAGWSDAMKKAGKCELDPATYFEKVGGVDVSVQLLAPRANPASRCALSQAKANLVSRCMRFLLQDKLVDGVKRLAKSVDGFRGLDEPPPASFVNATYGGADVGMLEHGNAIKDRLSSTQKKKVEAWKKDENVMSRLRQLANREIELYEFALGEYETQWARSGLGSC